MKTRSFVCAVVAAALTSAGPAAYAQRNDDRGPPAEHGQRDQRGDQRDQRGDQRDQRGDQRDDRGRPGGDQDRRAERGAGPNHDFQRGGRLPPEFRQRRYVVNDWRSRHLSAPPRGYQWVQTGSDYVLAAVATGVILSLILHD